MKKELIDFTKWLANEFDECNFLDELNVDDYLKSINLPNGEAKIVNENEVKRKICKAPKSFLPCNVNHKGYCNLPTHCDYQQI